MAGETSAGARNPRATMPDDQLIALRRNSIEAHRAAKSAYEFCCCVICGLELKAVLELAHLDHHAGNNDPDNLAWFCGTHHRMYDCGFYPIEAIKLMRVHWQFTRGVPDHKPRMKDAGIKAARKRDYQRRGLKAAATKKANAARLAVSVP